MDPQLFLVALIVTAALSAVSRATSLAPSVRSTGGLPGCKSTLSTDVGNEFVISAPPFDSSSSGLAGSRRAIAFDVR